MSDPVAVGAVVVAAFLLAGLVKGVVGMGLPTVAMGVLGLVMPTVEAAAILIVPSLVTNVWQLAAGPRFGPLARRLATMLAGVCVGTALGIEFMTGSAAKWAPLVLGATLVAYGIVGLVAPRFWGPRRHEPWLSPLIGAVTGALAGATGVFVVPLVPYVGSLGFTKDELIQALGLSFTVSTIALALALAAHGRFDPSLAGGSLLALFPALAGMYAGQALRDRLHPEAFRRWFFRGLIALGAYMVLRPLAG